MHLCTCNICTYCQYIIRCTAYCPICCLLSYCPPFLTLLPVVVARYITRLTLKSSCYVYNILYNILYKPKIGTTCTLFLVPFFCSFPETIIMCIIHVCLYRLTSLHFIFFAASPLVFFVVVSPLIFFVSPRPFNCSYVYTCICTHHAFLLLAIIYFKVY